MHLCKVLMIVSVELMIIQQGAGGGALIDM